ncbi:leucine-rich repeat domain-containing protein [Bacteroides faecis]|uniref:leucine-rich repeat domain-containing protein n=1 Tax=Bacteroides faecis TaxID=674529 RepID=UPI0034A30FA3
MIGCKYANCTGLSFLVFPKSLEYIGNYSFDGCSGLVNLYIGDNISYIGHCAFGHCANLEEVTLSENVASIQHNAFKESLNLRTIYCRSKNPPSVLEKHWHGSNKRSMNLYVPKGFSNRYKIQEGWRFFNIYEEDI